MSNANVERWVLSFQLRSRFISILVETRDFFALVRANIIFGNSTQLRFACGYTSALHSTYLLGILREWRITVLQLLAPQTRG